MEELISKISEKITKDDGEIWMSKIDLDYANGQAKLSKEASRHCVFSIIGDGFTGRYRFKKGFYRISDIPSVFQEHIDKVTGIQNTSVVRRFYLRGKQHCSRP